jgi:hypothetical protein
LRLTVAELADYPTADGAPGWELRETTVATS